MKKFLSVLLAVVMVLSTVSYAAPSLAGNQDSGNEAPVLEVPALEEVNEEATLAAVDSTEYGELVVRFTFDSLTANTDYTAAIQSVDGTNRPNVLEVVGGQLGSGSHMYATSARTPFFFDGQDHSKTIANDVTKHSAITAKDKGNGDKYLQFTGTGAATTFSIRDFNGGGLAKKGGHVIVTFDVLSTVENPITKANFRDTTLDSATNCKFNHYVNVDDKVTVGEWSTVAISYDDINDEAGTITGVWNSTYNSDVNWIDIYDATPNGSVLGIDNVTFWYIPAEVTHKVTHTSYDGGLEIAEADTVIGGGIKTVDEIGMAFNEDPKFNSAGYYLKKLILDGVEYSGSDKVNLTSAKTFTAVWDKLNLLEYGIEFNDTADFTTMKSYGGLRTNSGAAPTWSDNTEDGYVTINVTATADNLAVYADKGYSYAFIHDSSWGVPYIKQNGAIPAGAFEKFEMRLRYTFPLTDAEMSSTSLKYWQHQSNKENSINPSSLKFPTRFYGWLGGGGATQYQDTIGLPFTSMAAVNNKWITVAFDAETLGLDTKTVDQFRFDFDLPHGTTIDIDYIRFLGEPLPNVIIDMDGKAKNLGYKYTETTTVGDILSKIDYVGNETVTGLSLTKGGEPLSESTLIGSGSEDVTLYAILDTNSWIGKYGELVFELNFDNVNAGDESSVNFASYNVNPLNLGFRANPEHRVSTFTDMYFQTHGTAGSATFQPATYALKEDAEHGTYLEYTGVTDNGNYTLWILSTKANGASNTQFFTDKDGYFISTYDVKTPAGFTGNPHRTVYHHNGCSENDGLYIDAGTPGQWSEVVNIYGDGQIGNSSHATKITSITMINQWKLFDRVAKQTMAVDNIRLWWVPKTVDITVAAGDNDSVEDTAYSINPTETTVGDLMEMVYGNKKNVVGLSLTEDGELLPEDTLLTYAYPVTLYPKWSDIAILDEFSLEFDEETSITDGTVTFPRLRDKTNVTWNEDGYMTVHFEAADGYTGVYDNYILNNQFAPDSGKYLSPGAVDKLAIRVRFHGLAEGSYTTSSNGSQTLSYSSFKSCLHISQWDTAFGSNLTTTGWAAALNGSFENDKWYTIYIDADTCMPNGAGGMRFDTPYPMPDGASMDIDYIRFLPTNKYTLTVDNGENTSATVITMDAYPSTTAGDVLAKLRVDVGDKNLLGLSRTAGGAILAESEFICTTGEDTTLYAVWEDYEFLENFGYEFNDGVLPYSNHIQTTAADKTVTIQDGYLTIGLTATEGYTGVWDSQIYLPLSTSSFYNPSKYVPAGVVTNVRARIRFRGTGTESQSLTVSNGNTKTFDPANPVSTFIHWGAPGNKWGTNLKSYSYDYNTFFPEGIVDGRWFTLDIPTTSGNINLYDNGVGFIRFDFPYPMPSGTQIDVDYIRLVGDNDKLPEIDVSEYGTKVWEINFDKAAAGSVTSGTVVSDLGAEFSHSFFGASYEGNTKLKFGNATTELVAEADGTGNYIKYTSTADGTGPYMYVVNDSQMPFVQDDGYFIVTYDLINGTSAAVPHTFRINMKDLVEDPADNFMFIDNGDWEKAVLYYDKEIGSKDNDADGRIDSTSDITIVKWHNTSGTKTGDTICMDNITLWYVPKTVPVIIDNSAIGEENTIIEEYPTCGMTSEELAALLPTIDNGKFVGLSATEGGDLLYENRSAVPQILYSNWSIDTVLTVDMGDNKKLSNMTIQIPAGSSIKVSDIEEKFIDHGDKIFAGLSYTAGGTKLNSSDVIAASDSGEVTVYALWNDYYTNDFYSVEFDHKGEGVVGNGKESNLNAGKNSAYRADAMDASGNAAAGQAIDSLVWNEEEGYLTMKYDASGYAKAQAAENGYTALVWDSYIEINTLYDATVDATYLPAGDADYVVVRMRYRGMPASNQAYWRADTAEAYTLKPASVYAPFYYYTTTAGASFGSPNVYISKTVSVAEGSAYRENWFTVFIPASELEIDSNNVYRFRIDPNDGMPDGSAIDIDFIRFIHTTDVSKNFSAPVSLEDRTSARVVDPEEDAKKFADGISRNGVRVIGEITTTTATPSTEFGWMFTSSAKWNKSGTDGSRSWYELKMNLYDPNSSFIKVGYIKRNGEHEVNFFENESDLLKSFAAVLYNIPVKNYKSPFIVRPFAKIGNAYAYGEPFEINFLDVLEAAANSEGASDEVIAYYNECSTAYAEYLNANAEYNSSEIVAALNNVMSSSSSIKSSLIIPTNDTAPTVSGNIVTMKAWKDGSIVTLNVSTKDTYPAIIDTNTGLLSDAYAEKPCVYYLSDGVYYIKSLGRSTNAGGDYNGVEKSDPSAMEANVDGSALFLSEITDGNVASPFQRLPIDDELTNGKDSFFLGDFATGEFDFTFQRANSATRTITTGKTGIIGSDSKVVAKYNFADGTTEWVSFAQAQLLKMGLDSNNRDVADGIDFTNLTYVVSNNTTSVGSAINQREYEDLAVLAGVVNVPATVNYTTTNFLAAKYNKVIVKTTNAASYVTVTFTRTDGVSDSIKYYAYGTTADGYRLFDVDLYGMAKYHSTIKSLTVKANSGSVSYAYLVEDPDYYSSADLANMEATMIFQDTNYQNGFYVRDMDQKMKKNEFVNYTFANNGNTPVWMIDPWYSYDYSDSANKASYELYNIASPTATSLADSQGTKVVKFNGTKTSTYADGSTHTGDVLSLTLNSRAIYDGKTHTEMVEAGMTYWPHLLIEQSKEIYPVDVTRNSTGAKKIFMEMDVQMPNYTVDKDSYFESVGSKILSFLLYTYIRPIESPNDRIWFGAQIYSESNPNYPTWNRDTGASAYIYSMPQEVVFQGISKSFYQQIEDEITETSLTGSGTDSTSMGWVHISIDITPYIQTAIDWANREDAFGIGRPLTRDDFYFDGVNIGFETHGNIDGTFEIANFNFVAYN